MGRALYALPRRYSVNPADIPYGTLTGQHAGRHVRGLLCRAVKLASVLVPERPRLQLHVSIWHIDRMELLSRHTTRPSPNHDRFALLGDLLNPVPHAFRIYHPGSCGIRNKFQISGTVSARAARARPNRERASFTPSIR